MTQSLSQLVTIVVPTSPSPAHPSLAMINETVSSLLFHFPNAQVMLLCDGIRPELEHRRKQYEHYLQTLCESFPYHIIIHPRHRHQTAMLVEALPTVTTPLILWCEHDLPVRTDVPTDWEMMADAILTNQIDLARLMLMESIHPEHQHLMLGPVPNYPQLIKTRQWSGWTHLASTAMYRRILEGFDTRAKLMVERYIIRVLDPKPWEFCKMAVYIPDPSAARRIYHLHGRGGVDGGADDPHFAEQEIYPPR